MKERSMSRLFREIVLRSFFSAAFVWPLCHPVAFAQETKPLSDAPSNATRSEASVLVQQGSEFAKANKPVEAEAAFKEALSAAEARQGPHGIDVANVLTWHVGFYKSQKRYDEARSAAERAFGILARLGLDHSRVWEMQLSLGQLAVSQQRDAEAETRFRWVVEAHDRRSAKARR
jgi:hypothetical protein